MVQRLSADRGQEIAAGAEGVLKPNPDFSRIIVE